MLKFRISPFCSCCRLGIHNSKLLKCYLSLDPRVIQLVFAVRAWAKAKDVSCQLSNYALTLMVLYFLQTTSPPVIPSLQDPAEWSGMSSCETIGADGEEWTADRDDVVEVDGWNCSYLSDFTSLSPTKNTKTLGNVMCTLLLNNA